MAGQHYSDASKAKRREYSRNWSAAHPDKIRAYNQKLHARRLASGFYHSDDRTERKQLAKERLAGRPKPDLCEACGRGGKIVWDHCHESLVFRGWICESCNKALGFVVDNPAILRALADYLD